MQFGKCVVCRGVNTRGYIIANPQGAKSVLEIGDYCDLKYTVFMFYGTSNEIRIGEGTQVNAYRKGGETSFQVSNNSKIEIGNDCLMSNNILVSTTDFHQICNMDGEIVNKDKDVRIGNHVWIGQKAYIGKGVELGDLMVVGGYSVVTKSFKQENCVIAGNPATIKKENIDWKL